MNGRCQAFYCGAAVSAMFWEAGARRGGTGRGTVDADVLVVGAGPAGLTAAAELRRLGVPRVLVADREAHPAGFPGTAFTPATGCATCTGCCPARPTRGPWRTPRSARARSCGPGAPSPSCGPAATRCRRSLTSASGIEEVRPAAVLLATGCRERPRAARLVPGDRPSGVLTTGELQQRVYLGGERLGGRALVVGAEHVSFSAVVTLAHAGARVVALVTEQQRHQSYAAFRLGAALRWGVPVWTSTAVTRVTGAAGRLAAVDVAGAMARRAGADGRVRLAGVHRRLDSRPRARAVRGPGARPRHARPGGRHEPGDVGSGRVRRREPRPRGRDRRRGGAVRPARRPADRLVPGRDAFPGVRPGGSRSSPSRRCGGSRRTPSPPARCRRRSAGSRSGRPSPGSWPGWRPGRTAGCWPGRGRCD